MFATATRIPVGHVQDVVNEYIPATAAARFDDIRTVRTAAEATWNLVMLGAAENVGFDHSHFEHAWANVRADEAYAVRPEDMTCDSLPSFLPYAVCSAIACRDGMDGAVLSGPRAIPLPLLMIMSGTWMAEGIDTLIADAKDMLGPMTSPGPGGAKPLSVGYERAVKFSFELTCDNSSGSCWNTAAGLEGRDDPAGERMQALRRLIDWADPRPEIMLAQAARQRWVRGDRSAEVYLRRVAEEFCLVRDTADGARSELGLPPHQLVTRLEATAKTLHP